MYTLNQFAKSKWSLVVYQQQKIIFRSQASALKPLLRYIGRKGSKRKKVEIFDKYTGRAAALLISLIEPDKLYSPVVSQAGIKVLEEKKIVFCCLKKVKYLMNMASDDMCQWERLAKRKSAHTFLNLVE